MLVAYEVVLDLVRTLRPVVAQLRSYSPDAADQVERTARMSEERKFQPG